MNMGQINWGHNVNFIDKLPNKKIRDSTSMRINDFKLNNHVCAGLPKVLLEVVQDLCGSAFGSGSLNFSPVLVQLTWFRSQGGSSPVYCSPCQQRKACIGKLGWVYSRAQGCSYDPSRHQGSSSPGERGKSWTWQYHLRWRWTEGWEPGDSSVVYGQQPTF